MLQRVKTRWSRILSYIADIKFVATHIFCEGNIVADALEAPSMEEAVWFLILSSIMPLVNYDFYGNSFFVLFD